MVSRATHPELYATPEQEITKNLIRIEEKYGVRIILAVEQGSRSWGFSTKNSDYDVRFIYVPRETTYFSLESSPDTLDRNLPDWPVDSDLEIDMEGWAIHKAIRYAWRGNAMIHEWVNSPIVYRDLGVGLQISELMNKYTGTGPIFHHYREMGSKTYLHIDDDEGRSAKRTLYAFRSFLAAWVRIRLGILPPVPIRSLIDSAKTAHAVLNYAPHAGKGFPDLDLDNIFERLYKHKQEGTKPDLDLLVSVEQMRNALLPLSPEPSSPRGVQEFDDLLIKTIKEYQP